MLNQKKKGTRPRPFYCQNAKRTTERRNFKHNVYNQRRTTTRIMAEIIKDCTDNNDKQN